MTSSANKKDTIVIDDTRGPSCNRQQGRARPGSDSSNRISTRVERAVEAAEQARGQAVLQQIMRDSHDSVELEASASSAEKAAWETVKEVWDEKK
ncbi:hypothetical protein Slin15195_G031090 [Septoria linicola]|uniref:Uncharacterized protein n=1 Tax=Septoria linicola TaxID=215465 RepID=A0A9Q9AIR1_9PEZI|nr:hypothetical protein Slin14017_G030110 [Septoria linicola]USW49790.1 hypothetical protein Slin15195_G031090 [Septoria linicola]